MSNNIDCKTEKSELLEKLTSLQVGYILDHAQFLERFKEAGLSEEELIAIVKKTLHKAISNHYGTTV